MRWSLWVAGGLAGLVFLYLALTPTGHYLVRAGWEEAKILARRRSIVRMAADPRVPPATRKKLQMVLDARAFAKDSLNLAAGRSFATFSQLDSDTLVLVLSAAYRDRLENVTWWFPIVGSVPYKGYFDFARSDGSTIHWCRPRCAPTRSRSPTR